MRSLILVLVTATFSYLFDAILVGTLLYVLRDRFSLKLSKLSAPMVLLATFALLNLYWMPAVSALDIRLRILNQTAAEFLGLREEASLFEFYDFGWLDLFVWAMQILVALWVAEKLSSQNLSRPSNPAGANSV